MPGVRTTHVQAATSVALAWTFFVADDFDVKSLRIEFDAAPTTSENIVVSLDSGQGAGYDVPLRTFDPIGITSYVVENLKGFNNGDKVLVSYANTDLNAITGTAVVEEV